MSVLGYSHKEIVTMLAAAWCDGSPASRDGQTRLECYAMAGNRIMLANDKAYQHTYGDEDNSRDAIVTPDQIERVLVRMTETLRMDGYRVMDGIRYNLVANDGTDFADADILDDLLALFRSRCKRHELRFERRTA